MDEESMENLIVSIDFDKQTFPQRHTCDGDNVSPAIHIDRIQSQFLAVILEDRIGPDTMFCHWLIWNIEARKEIPENIPKDPVINYPFTAVQGMNDTGTTGYTGPCPPGNEIHTYFFNVYGLNSKLDVKPGANREMLEVAMKGHMVQYGGQAIATYKRR
jgi:Raf kinase inhibitor-like YbhB/YbcL family protein